jgi:GINS complex subunit 4
MDQHVVRTADDSFALFVFQQEIERMKYVIRSYLRCRISKIEKYTTHCLSDFERHKLSDLEVQYAERYPEST